MILQILLYNYKPFNEDFLCVSTGSFLFGLSLMKNTRHAKADNSPNDSVDVARHKIKTHSVKLLLVHIANQTFRNDLLINCTTDTALKYVCIYACLIPIVCLFLGTYVINFKNNFGSHLYWSLLLFNFFQVMLCLINVMEN